MAGVGLRAVSQPLARTLPEAHATVLFPLDAPGAVAAAQPGRDGSRTHGMGRVALQEAGGEVNSEVIRYLNRLSDLCWLWARYVETKSGAAL